MKIMPVQKQTRAGQRTRFKAFVLVGDFNGHIGLGVKCVKEVATSILGAINLAKMNVCPVRRGYWGSKLGKPHTVPLKVSASCGSVMVRLIPAPRGAGIVASVASKKVLQVRLPPALPAPPPSLAPARSRERDPCRRLRRWLASSTATRAPAARRPRWAT